MAKVRVSDGHLIVEMEGAGETLMAMRSEIKLPLAHVKIARVDPPELFDDTFIMRVFGASFIDTHIGYFWKKGDGMVFCDIHNLHTRGRIIAIDLQDERLKHLYVEPSDQTPDEAAAVINAALQIAPV